MKATCSKLVRLWLVLSAAFWLPVLAAPAQSSLGLRLHLANGYAGLSITGAVGTACQLQYATNLAPTSPWLWLTNLPLASNPQVWMDTARPATACRFYRALWVPTNMVLIPAGSFVMGDCMGDNPGSGPSGELPLHTVSVSAFYMDQYLVTSNLWWAVKAWNGGNGYAYDNAGAGKAGTHPVQMVSWYDVVKWCNARSQMEGLEPCYYTDQGLGTVYKTGQTQPSVKWAAKGYRLPTEAEWEKAARGGAGGHRFPWADADTITHARANYYADNFFSYDVSPTLYYHPAFKSGGEPYTSPVGYFAPNGYGLYDMAGNVYQWCWDWIDTSYYASPEATQDDPRGASWGSNRVLRGGSWIHSALGVRCAQRFSFSPANPGNVFGFRCVRGL